ncbi:MAG TPA: hypothetical protein VLJ42_05140 [Solirubrobacteraceae bacterium]|nr:hypothetical protein [Solirubrobacteraceae bacterium]
MRPRRLHRSSTAVMCALMVIIGVALIVQAVAGSGFFSPRLLLGVLFIAAGLGRLYVESGRAAHGPRSGSEPRSGSGSSSGSGGA